MTNHQYKSRAMRKYMEYKRGISDPYERTHNTPEMRGRGDMNVCERKLFEALKELGLDPKPQYQVGYCTLDFAFPDSQWAFEVNGPYHYTPEGKESDKRRRQFLHHTVPPWRIRSFKADRVFKNPMGVAKEIKRIIEENPEGGDNLGGWNKPFRSW